jgi:hypothetical protein
MRLPFPGNALAAGALLDILDAESGQLLPAQATRSRSA